MSWKISKTIDGLEYGHRVWTQKLNADFADDLQCACRRLHGHSGEFVVYMSGDTLINSMVTDFRHLEFAKRIFGQILDHRFVIDQNDPYFDQMIKPGTKFIDLNLPVTNQPSYFLGKEVDLSTFTLGSPEYEVYEGFTIVDFVPTSENLSKWVADAIQYKMNSIGVRVTQVDWKETKKSCSSYIVKEQK